MREFLLLRTLRGDTFGKTFEAVLFPTGFCKWVAYSYFKSKYLGINCLKDEGKWDMIRHALARR